MAKARPPANGSVKSSTLPCRAVSARHIYNPPVISRMCLVCTFRCGAARVLSGSSSRATASE